MLQKAKVLSCGVRRKLQNVPGFRFLANQRGDFYISDGVRVILAVVLGALLLAALTLLFNQTIIPKITTEINGLFN